MGNGTGITGLVLSIIGVAVAIVLTLINFIIIVMGPSYGFSITLSNYLALAMYLTPVLPAIGTILSIVGIATNDSKAPGIVGLVFGLIGVALSIVGILLLGFFQMMMMMPYYYYP
ncbi:MAG: hypothetical protein ACFFBP_02820 [Promethearchaeota archaeon]